MSSKENPGLFIASTEQFDQFLDSQRTPENKQRLLNILHLLPIQIANLNLLNFRYIITYPAWVAAILVMHPPALETLIIVSDEETVDKALDDATFSALGFYYQAVAPINVITTAGTKKKLIYPTPNPLLNSDTDF